MYQKKQVVFSMMHVFAGCLLFVLGIVGAQAAAVLQFSKLPDGGIVFAGEEARFTFIVTNIGDVDAHQPQLIDELPGAGIIKWETDITKDQNAACSFNVSQFVQTLVCDFDTLLPGQTAKAFIFGTTTTCPLTFNNSATVESTTALTVHDTGSLTILCREQPKLSIVKTPDGGIAAPGLIEAGDNAVFKILLTNDGPGIANDVALTDSLPNTGMPWNVEVLSGTPNLPPDNACSLSGLELTCAFKNLNAGETRTIVVKAKTTPLTCTPGGAAGRGTIAISNPAARATASNAVAVHDDGTILCRTANLCDIGIDKTCAVDTAAAAANPPKFECPNPFDGFSVEWNPGATKDAFHTVIADPNQVVDIRIWNGAVGSQGTINGVNAPVTGSVMVCSVEPGEVVQVSGLNGGKKAPAADQYWEVFPADPLCTLPGFMPTRKRLGLSTFRINCGDDDMKDANDCGNLLGDGKAESNKYNGFINDWRLAGISGDKKGDKDVLVCASAPPNGNEQQNCAIASPGDPVTYFYTVTNKGSSPVTVNIVDNKKLTAGGVIASNVIIPGKSAANPTGNVVRRSWGPVPISVTTINTATATGNAGQADQCVATDKVVVTTPCFMGNPDTRQLYPYGSLPARTAVVFNESETLQKLEPAVASVGDTLRVWYGDEHAMLLGITNVTTRTKNGTTIGALAPVSPFLPTYPKSGTKLAAEFLNPQTGLTEKQGGVDPAGRPIPPSLFCTDVTNHPLSAAGDWQMGGTAQGPNFISGTWKSATVVIDQTRSPATRTITTSADPAKNGFVFGPNADPVPAGLRDQGYHTEVRWDVKLNDLTLKCLNPDSGQMETLKQGHTYRMQFMVHDGDQNKSGGDVGEACSTVTIP